MEINQANLNAAFIGFNTSFTEGFELAQAHYAKVAMDMPSTAAQNLYPFLGMTADFREWIGDRQEQNLEAHQFSIVNKDFENTVSVDRNSFNDDQYGVYGALFKQLGSAARVHPDKLVFSLIKSGTTGLCYDGQPFFNANHPVGLSGSSLSMVSNYASGGGQAPWYLFDTSKALKPLIFQKRQDYTFVSMVAPEDEAVFKRKKFRYGVDARVNAGYGFWQYAYCSTLPLNQTNYSAAVAAMMNVTADNGEPLNVIPDLLVVPPSLRMTAKTLLNATFIPSAAGTSSQSNVLEGDAGLLVTPFVGT